MEKATKLHTFAKEFGLKIHCDKTEFITHFVSSGSNSMESFNLQKVAPHMYLGYDIRLARKNQ